MITDFFAQYYILCIVYYIPFIYIAYALSIAFIYLLLYMVCTYKHLLLVNKQSEINHILGKTADKTLK